MYETGPQVLSPVREPNQVDTVTWDVTREFLHPLASLHSTFPPLVSHSPISVNLFPLKRDDFQFLSLEGHSSDSPAGISASNETIFLTICLSFLFSSTFEEIDERNLDGENNTAKAPLCSR